MDQTERAPEVLNLFAAYARQIKVETHGVRVLSLLLYSDGSGYVQARADDTVYLKFSGLEDLYSQLVKLVTTAE